MVLTSSVSKVLVVLILFGLTVAQDEEVLTETPPETEIPSTPSNLIAEVNDPSDTDTKSEVELYAASDTVTESEVVSEVICQTCNCTIEGVVDCSQMELTNFFELQDWDGLKLLNPITVDLSQNHLTTVSRISSLPIQTLNLSNCEISIVEDASFIYLSDLVHLDLSKNQIATASLSRRTFVGVLSPDVGLLPYSKLRHLSLAYNDIHSLPHDIFTLMPGLLTLDLSGNPLAFIDQVTMAGITDLVNLRELYLSGCELETLPEGLFRRQRRLLRLDLSNNRFSTVPSVLNEASNLVYLNFGKNAIQVLESENAINNLTKLQDLRLCRNSKLQSIQAGALGGLRNLVTLHICYNPRLTTIDPDFLVCTDDHDVETWPMLTELHLNNNNISSVNSAYLHRWDLLSTIDVGNNAYVCDCTNQWVVDVLTPLLIKTDQDSRFNMICKKPSELRGVSFVQLFSANKTLSCPQNENYIDMPVPDMAILLGVMIGIFVTFPIVLVLVLVWKKGYFARCRSTKHEDYDDEETDQF